MQRIPDGIPFPCSLQSASHRQFSVWVMPQGAVIKGKKKWINLVNQSFVPFLCNVLQVGFHFLNNRTQSSALGASSMPQSLTFAQNAG